MTTPKRKTVGKIKEAKTFEKDVTLIRCHAIMMKDEYGQTIYTFPKKKDADVFYKFLAIDKSTNL